MAEEAAIESFALAVASSLLVAGLTVLCSRTASMRSRAGVILLSRLTGLGVWRVAPRQQQAARQIKADLRRARWVCVLTGRGNELTRDTFAPVWEDGGQRIESVQILLPNSELGPSSVVSRREEDMRRIDPGFSRGLLAEQVRLNAAYIREIAHHRRAIEMRFYDLPKPPPPGHHRPSRLPHHLLAYRTRAQLPHTPRTLPWPDVRLCAPTFPNRLGRQPTPEHLSAHWWTTS